MNATALRHFNTAGSGLMPPAVLDAVVDYLRQEAAEGAYETEQRFAPILDKDVYHRLAALVGAAPDDVALFDSATRAWCTVICQLRLRDSDRVWVTPYEYAGNLISLMALRKRYGFTIEVIPTRPDGDLDLEWMAAHLDGDVALVCVTHVPSGCGLVNPVAEIGALLAGHRALYAVDACQSVGQLAIDAVGWGCDVLTGAGRKFLRGPRGTGFAYVAPSLRAQLEPPFHDLHVARMTGLDGYTVTEHGARALELAERSNAAIVGFDATLQHHGTTDRSAGPVVYRALTEALAEVPGVELILPGTTHSGIASFVHDRLPAELIKAELSERRFNTWLIVGEHTPLYMTERGVTTAVRASSHYYNTLDEVAELAAALREIVAG